MPEDRSGAVRRGWCIAAPVYNAGSRLTISMKPTLHHFWLLFAQIATVCLGILFVVATLRPDLLTRIAGRNNVVLVQESAPTVQGPRIASLADAASDVLVAAGMPAERIRVERFGPTG